MNDQELTRWAAEFMKAQDIVFTPFGECHIIDKDNIWMTFDPLHDLNHAFMVVERMRELGWLFAMGNQGKSGPKWKLAEFWNGKAGKENILVRHGGDNWGKAICLAALEAVEK